MLEFEDVLELDETYEQFHMTKLLNSETVTITDNNKVWQFSDKFKERVVFTHINNVPTIICIGKVKFAMKSSRCDKIQYNDYYEGTTVLYKYDGREWNRTIHRAVYLYHDTANIYMWEFNKHKIWCVGSVDRLIETVPYNKFITLFVLNGEIFAKITLDETYFLPKISQLCTSVVNSTEHIHIRLEIDTWTSKWYTFTDGIFWNITSPNVFQERISEGMIYGTSEYVLTPDGQHIPFNTRNQNDRMYSYWYRGYFIFNGRAHGCPKKTNIRHLQPSHRKMTTFLVWCLNQPSKFLDKKHTYYCPIDVFIEYILVDVLLKLRDKVGHAEEGASVEGCGSCEEFLDED